jgi:hypothetical protein
MGWMIQVGIPAGAGDVSLLHIIQTSRGAHPASYPVHTGNICQGQSGWDVILTAYLHVAQMLRMSRDIPPFTLYSFMARTGTALPLPLPLQTCLKIYIAYVCRSDVNFYEQYL